MQSHVPIIGQQAVPQPTAIVAEGPDGSRTLLPLTSVGLLTDHALHQLATALAPVIAEKVVELLRQEPDVQG